MRALIVHNDYASSSPSGENNVVRQDIEDLREDGVEVEAYIRRSDEIDQMTLARRLELPLRPTWSFEDQRAVSTLLRQFRPDVVHLHNVYPLISPTVVRVARRSGARVVQTVHNYRHTCAAGTHFRAGDLCFSCSGKRFPFPAVQYGCYRGSRPASVAMALSMAAHDGTWRAVDLFLPVSEIVAATLRDIGIDDSKIRVRRNRMSDPGPPSPPGRDLAYIGRLTPEKGIQLLLDAWARSASRATHQLHIAGSGPMQQVVLEAASYDASIVAHGQIPQPRVDELLMRAAAIVVPSLWPEPDGLGAVRALAFGRPVIATRRGALAEYIDDSNGWLCEPWTDDLAHAVDSALGNPAEAARRGAGARNTFVSERDVRIGRLSAVYSSLLEAQPLP